MEHFDETKDFGTRKTGMKVPDNYFSDFSTKMEFLINAEEKVEADSAPKISIWNKVKPWMYLAAMFVSFVVVFKVFLVNENNVANNTANASLTEKQNMFEQALIAPVNDYDVYEYLFAESE